MIFSGFFSPLFLRKQRKNIKLGGEEGRESLGGAGGQRTFDKIYRMKFSQSTKREGEAKFARLAQLVKSLLLRCEDPQHIESQTYGIEEMEQVIKNTVCSPEAQV